MACDCANIGSNLFITVTNFQKKIEDEFNVPCSHYNGYFKCFKNEKRICVSQGKEKAGYGLQAMTKTMASGVNVCDFKLIKCDVPKVITFLMRDYEFFSVFVFSILIGCIYK